MIRVLIGLALAFQLSPPDATTRVRMKGFEFSYPANLVQYIPDGEGEDSTIFVGNFTARDRDLSAPRPGRFVISMNAGREDELLEQAKCLPTTLGIGNTIAEKVETCDGIVDRMSIVTVNRPHAQYSFALHSRVGDPDQPEYDRIFDEILRTVRFIN